MQALTRHDWPGNVRELENINSACRGHVAGRRNYQRSILISNFADRLVVDVGRLVHEGTPLAEIMGHIEKMALAEAIQAAEGDRSHAARLLGLDRPTFYEKLQDYGLSSKA